MKDAWNMAGGKVYVAPVGADPKDPSRWHQLGTLTEIATERQTERWHHRSEVIETMSSAPEYTLTTQGPVTLFKPEPVKTRPSVEFTFNTTPFSLDALALYYGTDVKAAGIVNNRGKTRKEEKRMGVRKFKSMYGKSIVVNESFGDADLEVGGRGSVIIKKADVPLIAHALFEKSGWPTAKEDSVGDWEAETLTGTSTWGFKVRSDEEAAGRLLDIIANLAAYNAWVEGAAEREAAEAAKKAEAEAARKREHDELRTSAIALEALEIYNERFAGNFSAPYASWDAVNSGKGASDERVREYIAKAEAARAAKPAPKVGDRVRVSADSGVSGMPRSYFGGEVEGVVIEAPDAEKSIRVKAQTSSRPEGHIQWVDLKYVTILATAEEVAAEKAKAERDAGIVDLSCVMGISRRDAEVYYNRGIRATA